MVDRQPDPMMAGLVINAENPIAATLLTNEDLPEITLPDGAIFQLLQVDLNQNLWVLRTRLRPGYQIATHYHTGQVFGVTLSGEWFYKEFPDNVNKPGSYLYQPAHSVHTLSVAGDASEDAVIWFAIWGSELNMDDDGKVVNMLDAKSIVAVYRAMCKAEGKNCDKVIVHGE